MKCKFLLVLVFAGILCCAAQQYGGSPRHDIVKLSLLWPNSYCLTNDHNCRPNVPQYFTIDGLWAEMNNGDKVENCETRYYMTNSMIDRHKVELLKYWPDLSTYNYQDSKQLWKNKWETDGTCCSDLMRPEDYLASAMNLRQSHNIYQILTNAGILANGSSYPATKILAAIRKATRFMVDIVCETDRVGNVYLSEIHQCLDNHAGGFVDCDNKAVNCDQDPIFPDALFAAAAKNSRKVSPTKRTSEIHA
ncbi:hypothetical protein L6164_005678 [Bauhinia variegata]|uniref:Uncharacterized protein n=1 Tax=Bauhinia variegata TaxID=167791 RepID=A0ACB9PU51_BAUVA|nr:hypothetical protein L6164_005678 [Bauhinia variegata]